MYSIITNGKHQACCQSLEVCPQISTVCCHEGKYLITSSTYQDGSINSHLLINHSVNWSWPLQCYSEFSVRYEELNVMHCEQLGHTIKTTSVTIKTFCHCFLFACEKTFFCLFCLFYMHGLTIFGGSWFTKINTSLQFCSPV